MVFKKYLHYLKKDIKFDHYKISNNRNIKKYFKITSKTWCINKEFIGIH